jgi:tetratricopeptide (TPR) repeat protein
MTMSRQPRRHFASFGMRRAACVVFAAAAALAAAAQGFAGQGADAPIDTARAPPAPSSSQDAPHAEDDFDRAIALHEERLSSLRLFAAAHPSSKEAQQDLWGALIAMGDAHMRAGFFHKPRARTHFQESLDIARGLAAAEPESRPFQRNVAVSLTRMGDALQHVDPADFERMKESYEQSLALFRRLAESDSAAADAQRDLAWSLAKLGGALISGDPARSRALLQESLTIRNGFARADPTSASLQRGIAHTLLTLGLLEEFDGDLAASRAALRRAISIFEDLVQREPGPRSEADLTEARDRLASLANRLARNGIPDQSGPAGRGLTRALSDADEIQVIWRPEWESPVMVNSDHLETIGWTYSVIIRCPGQARCRTTLPRLATAFANAVPARRSCPENWRVKIEFHRQKAMIASALISLDGHCVRGLDGDVYVARNLFAMIRDSRPADW